MIRLALCLAFLAATCAGLRLAAQAEDGPDATGIFDGKVHFEVTPYVWVPTINGKFKYNFSDIHDQLPSVSGSFNTQIGPNKYLSNLNFALMGNAAVRQGKTAIFTDVINVNVGNQTSSIVDLSGPLGHVNASLSGAAQTHASGTIWTAGGSGTVYHHGRSSVDLLLGGRIVWLNASTDFQLNTPNGFINRNGSASKSDSFGAAILGTYGTFALSKKVSVPFYLDAGSGDPNFTWQGILGLKYGQASLSYRYLDYSNGGSGLIQNLRLNGPQVGYTIRF